MEHEKDSILISACLVGERCRYDGNHNKIDCLDQLSKKYRLVSACPEQLGGLDTPRDPAEKLGNRVITTSGLDVTKAFFNGAKETLKRYHANHCKFAVLKERSPSCGCGKIYDGSFQKNLIDGNGMTAQLFLDNGIVIFGESDM